MSSNWIGSRSGQHVARPAPPKWLLFIPLAMAALAVACAPAQPSATGAAAKPPERPAEQPAQRQETVTLKVGTLPISEMLPLYIGKDEGIFRGEGIELELTTLTTGAAGIPAMESGSLNIVYSNIVSILQAVEQGLDLRIVAPGSLNATDCKADVSRYLALKESGMESLADLKGKRIAINALRNVNDLYNTAMLDAAGLRPGEYTVTEVAFPQMVDALMNKQVDAVLEVEPFITILLDTDKVRDLGSAYCSVHTNFYLAHYTALQRWLDRNPDTARRFQRAYFKSVEYTNTNRDKLGDWAVQHVRLRPELKDKVVMPEWRTIMEGEYLESQLRSRDLMLKYGYLKNSVDVAPLIFK
jgi:ABC-type nitrate/sulfonate/bicarbonate transport system substrate-binding protein